MPHAENNKKVYTNSNRAWCAMYNLKTIKYKLNDLLLRCDNNRQFEICGLNVKKKRRNRVSIRNNVFE